SANPTSRDPIPAPRQAGSVTSIPNSASPLSSRCTRTHPTTRPSSHATAISPARISPAISFSLVRDTSPAHNPASASAYTRLTSPVSSPTRAASPAASADSNRTSTCDIIPPYERFPEHRRVRHQRSSVAAANPARTDGRVAGKRGGGLHGPDGIGGGWGDRRDHAHRARRPRDDHRAASSPIQDPL